MPLICYQIHRQWAESNQSIGKLIMQTAREPKHNTTCTMSSKKRCVQYANIPGSECRGMYTRSGTNTGHSEMNSRWFKAGQALENNLSWFQLAEESKCKWGDSSSKWLKPNPTSWWRVIRKVVPHRILNRRDGLNSHEVAAKTNVQSQRRMITNVSTWVLV